MSAATTAAPASSERSSGASMLARVSRELDLIVTPALLVLGAIALWLYMSNGQFEGTVERALDGRTLRNQFWQHVQLTGWSTFWVILIAIPMGILATRPWAKRLTPYILGLGNAGQAIPAYGLLVILLPLFGTGARTVIYGLIVYSALPVLRNTMVGVQQVDAEVIEAARGMGMTRLQVLRRIELPLAVPVILAGVRTALVINVGTAALAFLIGGGGLGESINTGLKLQRDPILIVGAGLTALLALTIDWLAALAERFLRPTGLR